MAQQTTNTSNTEIKTPRKRVCMFCESKTEPLYTDSVTLKRFMSDRAKITSRTKTGTCSKHQRALAREIKHARHLALLPFVARI